MISRFAEMADFDATNADDPVGATELALEERDTRAHFETLTKELSSAVALAWNAEPSRRLRRIQDEVTGWSTWFDDAEDLIGAPPHSYEVDASLERLHRIITERATPVPAAPQATLGAAPLAAAVPADATDRSARMPARAPVGPPTRDASSNDDAASEESTIRVGLSEIRATASRLLNGRLPAVVSDAVHIIARAVELAEGYAYGPGLDVGSRDMIAARIEAVRTSLGAGATPRRTGVPVRCVICDYVETAGRRYRRAAEDRRDIVLGVQQWLNGLTGFTPTSELVERALQRSEEPWQYRAQGRDAGPSPTKAMAFVHLLRAVGDVGVGPDALRVSLNRARKTGKA
ncbi:MAG: hypothetical protein ACHREM_11710 [Polyangiales bacterium]